MKFAALVLAGAMAVVPVKIQAQKVSEYHPSVECLALNMYHEARSQGTAGLFAVSAVVINRVNDSRFPNSVCEVVYQGPTRESWKTRQHKDLPDTERQYYPIKNMVLYLHGFLFCFCPSRRYIICMIKQCTICNIYK